MPNITATHVNYAHICLRKLWLFHNGIAMEHTSNTVAEGKLIGETTYTQRPEQYTELALDSIKIDFYDAKNKVVHEVKKSDAAEQAHIAQVQFYLFILEKHGITAPTGIIEYPKLRTTQMVPALTPDQKVDIERHITHITQIIENDNCPPTINKSICKRCSYYDFCYVTE